MSADGRREGADDGAGEVAWLGVAERGSLWALRAGLWLLRKLGLRGMRPILYPISLYFYLTGHEARRASRAYLERVASYPEGLRALGGKPGWRHGWRHFVEFSESTLVRIALFAGCADELDVEIHGREQIDSVQGRGVLLLGAHLGSFDLLRAAADDHKVHVNVVMYTDNAQRINTFLDDLDPQNSVRMIGIEPGSVRASFAVRACLERDEFVALLADRSGPRGLERVRPVSFLGATAQLPESPFLLPLVLNVPARLLFALKTGPRRYEIFTEPHFEPAADSARLTRDERRKLLEEHVQAYAARLEHYCLRYPYQWFNFFDFWAAPAAGGADRERGGRRG